LVFMIGNIEVGNLSLIEEMRIDLWLDY
jgi:hypothetical protein